MVVEFVKGETREYVAQIDFALNFDDRDIKSVKVKKGRALRYDGEIAVYLNDDGATVSGRCSSLKCAINALNWLIPRPSRPVSAQVATVEKDLFGNAVPSPTTPAPQRGSKAVTAPNDYDPLKGGSFDTAAVVSNDFHIAGQRPKREIIKEEDLIVKHIPALRKTEEKPKHERLEIALDQNAVKKVGEPRLTVSSSTAVAGKEEKRSHQIIMADEMNADSTIPLKRTASATTDTSKPAKKSSFIVDNTTPRTINEDMTLKEVHRVTKVINADESQDARVVSTIDRSKIKVKEVDGITLRRPEPQSHDIKLKKVKTPQDMTITTTVGAPGSGGGEVFDATADGVEIVGKVGKKFPVEPEIDLIADTVEMPTSSAIELPIDVDDLLSDIDIDIPVDATSSETEEVSVVAEIPASVDAPLTAESLMKTPKELALERAAARKKASAATQKRIEDANPATQKRVEDANPEPVKKKPTKKVVKKAAANTPKTTPESSNYLLMLPEEWGELHWTKKEKFVKELTDIDFIKYLLVVETANAVQNACRERLNELGEEISG